MGICALGFRFLILSWKWMGATALKSVLYIAFKRLKGFLCQLAHLWNAWPPSADATAGVGTMLRGCWVDSPLGIRRMCPWAVSLLLHLARHTDGRPLSPLIGQQGTWFWWGFGGLLSLCSFPWAATKSVTNQAAQNNRTLSHRSGC